MGSIDGVNGNRPLFGNSKAGSTNEIKNQKTFGTAFNYSTNEIGDSINTNNTEKTTLYEQMMELAVNGDVKLDSKRNKEIDDAIAMIYADDVEDIADEFGRNGVHFNKQDLDTVRLIRQNITNPLA